MSTQTVSIRDQDSIAGAEARRNNQLTAREIRILQCAADGEDCKGTAELIGLAPGTVKQLRHKIALKLGAETVHHAVAQALRRRIIS
jgi:DNA-binding CsgD family transcriptional regulator